MHRWKAGDLYLSKIESNTNLIEIKLMNKTIVYIGYIICNETYLLCFNICYQYRIRIII